MTTAFSRTTRETVRASCIASGDVFVLDFFVPHYSNTGAERYRGGSACVEVFFGKTVCHFEGTPEWVIFDLRSLEILGREDSEAEAITSARIGLTDSHRIPGALYAGN